MVAVRALLATLNGFTQASGFARGWRQPGERPAGGCAEDAEAWYEGAWAHAGDEPPLEELLHDPVVRLVMRADHLEPAQVRRWLRPKHPDAMLAPIPIATRRI